MKKLFLICLLCSNAFATTQYVYNVTKDEVVIDYASELVRPIASVTKLMTAIVVIESHASMTEKIPYKGFLGTAARSRGELLSVMLVKSDNQAAEALAKSYYGGRVGFINAMNYKAKEIGMSHTTYEDPSGIGHENQSTARDLTILLQYAYGYDTMREIASTQSFSVVEPSKKKNKNRVILVNNTNIRLLHDFKEIEISKTGFTNSAGKCLAMYLTKNGERYTIVILGEKNTQSVQKVGRNIIEKL